VETVKSKKKVMEKLLIKKNFVIKVSVVSNKVILYSPCALQGFTIYHRGAELTK